MAHSALNPLLPSPEAAVLRRTLRGRSPTFFPAGAFLADDSLGLPGSSLGEHLLYGPYNTQNFPVGVVPVTTVTPQDQEELAFYKR